MISAFEAVGAAGLVLVIIGILTKKRKTQDIYYMSGGACLAAYSIWLQNIIFIILQSVFTIAAVYDFVKIRSKK